MDHRYISPVSRLHGLELRLTSLLCDQTRILHCIEFAPSVTDDDVRALTDALASHAAQVGRFRQEVVEVRNLLSPRRPDPTSLLES